MDLLASFLVGYGHRLTWGLIVASLLFAPLLRDELPRRWARGWRLEVPPGWGSVLAAASPYHRRAALELHVQLLRHCASGSD